MRVFLPDDRKIAAKPSSSSLSPKEQRHHQQQNNNHKQTGTQQQQEEEERHCYEGNQQQLQQEEERANKRVKFDNYNIMGGGGRLLGGPSSSSSSHNHDTNTTSEGGLLHANHGGRSEQQQQHDSSRIREEGNNNNNNILSSGASSSGGGVLRDELLNNNYGTHHTVAAASSSPHRSTISAVANRRITHHNNNIMNPEVDDGIWQDNEGSTSGYNISLGKSDSHTHSSSSRRYKPSRDNASSMLLSSSVAAPAPLLNGPIPGSIYDPATVSSKSNKEQVYYNVDNDKNAAEDNEEANAILSRFIHLLRTQHKPPLECVEMDGDGNCLFRAISLQVYGDATMHLEVRRQCLDFMEREADHFRSFVAGEEFDEYIARKRVDGVHGNHTEIQAMSELYNRSIEVFVPDNGIEPINIFHSEYKSADAPIRLSYMDGNHYNAIIDPLLPTAGLGLGLPNLQPGLADKLQLEEAKKISDETANEEKMRLAIEESNRVSKSREEMQVKEALRKSSELATTTATVDSDEDVYKKKAMYLSELDAADFDLEQAVLASSLESYRLTEQERKPSSLRRGDGRRGRFNSSPRNQRASSNSPVYRSSPNAAIAASSCLSSNHTTTAATASSSVASLSRSSAPVAEASSSHYASNNFATTDEYPASVQELVMNGFELGKVLHAYELIGDNFDDLLSFLLSSAT